MKDVKLLGEDDFLNVMNTRNKEFLDKCVINETFKSFDGCVLNYYYAIPEKPRACITIVHGLGEFFLKYHEMFWYFHQLGYAVFFLEQRGHGYSEGKMKEHDIIHIGSYNTYVKDLKAFLDLVVTKKISGIPNIVFAHSMGGAIATLFLEQYPEYFKGAVLSSPMLKLKGAEVPFYKLLALKLYSLIPGKKKSLSPGQHHFTGKPEFETGSALSRPRYDRLFNERLKDMHYQTSGATVGWVLASLKATKKAIKNTDIFRTPVCVFTAGQDHLVSQQGFEEFRDKVPFAQFYHYEKSRHEIYNADETTRKSYYHKLFEVLDSFTEGA